MHGWDMITRRDEGRPRVVRCAECHREILTGEGRYNEPDGKSYHPTCYDALQPAPMTAILTRMLEEEGRRLAEVVHELVAIQDDWGAIHSSSPSPPTVIADEPLASPRGNGTMRPPFSG